MYSRAQFRLIENKILHIDDYVQILKSLDELMKSYCTCVRTHMCISVTNETVTSCIVLYRLENSSYADVACMFSDIQRAYLVNAESLHINGVEYTKETLLIAEYICIRY